MDNLKKLVVVLGCIVLFLIVCVVVELTSDKNNQVNYAPPKELIVHKKDETKSENEEVTEVEADLEEIEDTTVDDISEEQTEENISINNEKEFSTSENLQEYSQTYNNESQEHHEIINIPATPSRTLTTEEKIKQNSATLGTAGRLYIPSINIDLGLNHANIYNGDGYNAQDIVDREDSAAFYTFGSKLTISDHDYQGFSKIGNLNIYDKAYIKKNSSTVEVYELINKFAGKNTGPDLIDNYGNSVKAMNGNLIMYTCYGSGNGIMITLWNKIS